MGFFFEGDFSFLVVSDDKLNMKEICIEFLEKLSKTFLTDYAKNDDFSNTANVGLSWKAKFSVSMKNLIVIFFK